MKPRSTPSGKPSSKFRLELSPQLPAGFALRKVLAKLLEMLRANEAGTLADADPEFLHDFRVAVRRTRSCVGQMKRALPAPRVKPFRGEFAWLGKITGPTRDLDVFLLDLERWVKKLSEVQRGSLEPLHDLVRKDQRAAQRELAAQLQTARYHDLLAGWNAFVQTTPGPDEAPDAERPIVAVAEERIRARYEAMLRKGNRLDPLQDVEGLHRLRIEGKRLRYLLEFFRSVFPADAVKPLIGALKQLQDELGEFNDLQIQQAALRAMIPRMSTTSDETLVTVGLLIERLEQRERSIRRAFRKRFDSFSSAETQTLIKRLAETGDSP